MNFIKNYYKIYIESENKMNTEELGYYLFADSEELKRKEKRERRKINRRRKS